ncbi:L,D-transpeptidase [Streptomyces jumonjinensis]|uniref:L,D-transpeptidase n=1 Tax=Streptomyces jumonjinensis TaxID=1945 RepID=UPI0037908843
MRSISTRRLHRPRRRSTGRRTALVLLTALFTTFGLAAGPAVAAGRTPDCSAATGPYQTTVERHLGVTPDGVQSAADCAAIRTLQSRNGMEAANGYAGLETWRIVQYEKARADPMSLTGCPHGARLAVCVDLNRQLLWVRDGAQVAYGPVPIRSGKPGYATRTGVHRIHERVEKQWSELYEGPMPFSQFFDGGQALHASYRDIWEEPGSHGCVNLRYEDARRLWRGLRLDDAVHVWGTRGP